MIVGYARCSTEQQDLTAQRQQLVALGADPDRIYVDQCLSGKNRARPGLREALAAVHPGDTLLVTKLDRLARSVPDARAIADELAAGSVALSLGGAVHDPTDPVGRLLFNALAMVAEFERDLISQRTREGMAIARQRGRLKGKMPKLKPAAVAVWVESQRLDPPDPHQREPHRLQHRPRRTVGEKNARGDGSLGDSTPPTATAHPDRIGLRAVAGQTGHADPRFLIEVKGWRLGNCFRSHLNGHVEGVPKFTVASADQHVAVSQDCLVDNHRPVRVQVVAAELLIVGKP